MSESTHKTPTLIQSLIPVASLVVLLFFSALILFGDNSSYGPNQIAMILSACVAAVVGMRCGFTWKEIETAMVKGISLAMGAIFILLVVGSLIGTWILSGIVPTMVYYGLQVLHPTVFYAATCIICSVVALATGSSWTTAGTIGLALVGIAEILGLSPGITAGAIISGAYFGDKLSPLSDTTNLAPAMAGTELFVHIRHMLWTTVPSLTIAVILFALIGFFGDHNDKAVDLEGILTALDGTFNLGWYLLIPPAAVIFMVIKKVPAFPALLIGALLGCVFAAIFQQNAITGMGLAPATYPGFIEGIVEFLGRGWVDSLLMTVKVCWTALFDGFTAKTGNAALDELLSRGGMSGMLPTIWLIISAMMFGAVLEKTGMLTVIASKILGFAKSTGSLVVATLGTCIGMNIIASDQYIAIVLPGRMFRAEFEKRKLAPQNLSRCLEDSGTLTSVLIPWNTCGAFMASTLGVATGAYWYFCFFNLMNPVISAIYGFTGFSIEPLDESALTEDLEAA